MPTPLHTHTPTLSSFSHTCIHAHTCSPFPKVLALFSPFFALFGKARFFRPVFLFLWKSPFLSFFSWKSAKIGLLMNAITVSECSMCLSTLFFFWGNKMVRLVPGVHNAEKVGFLNFTSCFVGPINWRARIHFSARVQIWTCTCTCIMAMLHWKKEHLLPVLTEKEHFLSIFWQMRKALSAN